MRRHDVADGLVPTSKVTAISSTAVRTRSQQRFATRRKACALSEDCACAAIGHGNTHVEEEATRCVCERPRRPRPTTIRRSPEATLGKRLSAFSVKHRFHSITQRRIGEVMDIEPYW